MVLVVTTEVYVTGSSNGDQLAKPVWLTGFFQDLDFMVIWIFKGSWKPQSYWVLQWYVKLYPGPVLKNAFGLC